MRIDIIKRIFNETMKPLKRKILLMVGRGELNSTDDSKGVQTLSVSLLAGEDGDGKEKIGHYGYAYHAPKGSDVVMVSIAGARENGIIIATESRQYRLKDLGEGEVAIYSMNGDYVHLKNGNVIDIKTNTLNIDASTSVNITTQELNVTASTKVNLDTPEVAATTKITAGDAIEGATTIEAGTTVTAGSDLIATIAVQAPAIAAGTSLTVGGVELNDYDNHTHNYIDDVTQKVTDVPN